jgi:hypothetical protein
VRGVAVSRFHPPYADLDRAVVAAFIGETHGLFKGHREMFADVAEFYLALLGIDPTDEMMGTACLHLTAADPQWTRLEYVTRGEPTHA